MKLKKIFLTSHSSKEILKIIDEAYEAYLKRYQTKANVSLVLSAYGNKNMLTYELVSRYEKEQQDEINKLADIIHELNE